MLRGCAGNVGPNNNFVCELKCENGPNAFADVFKGPRRNVSAGIFDPPYRCAPDFPSASVVRCSPDSCSCPFSALDRSCRFRTLCWRNNPCQEQSLSEWRNNPCQNAALLVFTKGK